MTRLPVILLSSLSLAAAGSAGSGIPFGLFGMNGSKLVDPYTSAMQQGRPQTILQDLAAAKARGARIVVNFSGGGRNFTDSQGHFDFDAWKARLDRFAPIAGRLNAYAADGTLFASMIMDEPFVSKRWGGQEVPVATLDRMAQYSKALFPALPTVVGSAPSTLRSYPWRYLDAGWAQYTARKGTVTEYVSTEAGAAREEGLGLIVGLNISKGGDGSSGYGKPKEWSMTGKEILEYGHALLGVPSACAFISWDSRPDVINRPDVSAALRDLAAAAQAHPETSCRQRAPGAPPRASTGARSGLPAHPVPRTVPG
ncbi:MAG TPA: hypothetical protein VHL81_01770 [Gemmatimonadales bacterium]|nr:hypothetical protein [Gemmatimonadales bacterium]